MKEILDEDDENIYKMCRNSPIESETKGLKVGNSVTFKQTDDRINKVTVCPNPDLR